jgi:dynein heavy chain 1
VTRQLIKNKVDNPKSFEWLSQMRFYFDPKQTDVLQQLSIQMANAKFNYVFEYLGVQDKLVQTPLTDRCYLTMTQALEARFGGAPFGMLHELHVTTPVLRGLIGVTLLPQLTRLTPITN